MAILLFAFPCIAAELPLIGDLPPGITLPNLDGKPINLSDYSGKPVILTFFASWSQSCQQELAALQELSSAYGHSIEILAVSFDKKSKTLKDYVDQQKLNLNFLIDKKLVSQSKYAVMIIPTTYIIGSDGKIDSILVDYDDNVKKSLEGSIKEALSKK